jgi:UDP-N-acetylglucosamine--N-acetylmuramyl-(pentapeptide) pyrophosphoryl-undecaprenol N-acetylglucosamine transferase
VFAQWACTSQHFARPEIVETTGCPVRPEFLRADRAAGIARFGLDAGKRTLLVTGASQGARSINLALVALREELARQKGWQVLHLSGREDEERVRAAYTEAGVAAVVAAFTREMAEALAAADLVISRAGASTLAELTAVGRAAVLLPYPYHKDQHQRHNAEELVRAGAAELVEDRIEGEANAAALRGVLARLMGDAGAVERMSAAATGMGRRNATAVVAERVLALSLT